MNILFLTQICPYPPTNGSAIKTYNILKHLGKSHEVNLLMFIRNESEVSALSHLSQYCRQMDFCKLTRSGMRNVIQAAGSLLSCRSFIISRDRHSLMHAKVQNALQTKPDLIYVDHLQMFQFVPIPAPAPVVLDDHNVEWKIIERFSSSGTPILHRTFGAVEWRKLRKYELDACRKSEEVLTVTGKDRNTLAANGIPASKITALPVGVDIERFQPLPPKPDTANLLMFGTMSWPPNSDAVVHFADCIYPAIKQKVPEAQFQVVGANPPAAVSHLARDPSIQVTGFVEDLAPFCENAAVFVVPLRIGSGIRVKILDAMAMGLPVVTTSIGCEGIALRDQEDAIIADDPEEFAEAVIGLLRDPEERARLGSSGRRLVEDEYSWPPILSRLDRVLSKYEH